MIARAIFAIATILLAAGCASFDGRGLIPGKSTQEEVEALMGAPAHRVTLPNGDTARYFSRLPEGRAVYVVTVGPDGVMKSIEQRLVRSNLKLVSPGTSTKNDVRDLFGPPSHEGRLERQGRTWWAYKYVDYDQRREFWVQYSDDGVVREMFDMIDNEQDDICSPSMG
jgi:hypothetical protein